MVDIEKILKYKPHSERLLEFLSRRAEVPFLSNELSGLLLELKLLRNPKRVKILSYMERFMKNALKRERGV